MGQTTRVFGSEPFLGREQELTLEVRFTERTILKVKLDDLEGGERITVNADVTGIEGRYNMVTDCLGELCRQFEAVRGEQPMRLQVMTWEKVLIGAWGRVLSS